MLCFIFKNLQWSQYRWECLLPWITFRETCANFLSKSYKWSKWGVHRTRGASGHDTLNICLIFLLYSNSTTSSFQSVHVVLGIQCLWKKSSSNKNAMTSEAFRKKIQLHHSYGTLKDLLFLHLMHQSILVLFALICLHVFIYTYYDLHTWILGPDRLKATHFIHL